MKVLKSGIEIDPRKLKKVKGGACACFCEYSTVTGAVTTPATYGDVCICQCEHEPGDPESFNDHHQSADKRI